MIPTAALRDRHSTKAATLVEKLRESGYDEAGVAAALTVKPEQISGQTGRLGYYLGGREDLATSAPGLLAQLFLFGRAVSRAAFHSVLPADLASLLVHQGLVRMDGARGAATVSITPYQGLLIVADPLLGETAARVWSSPHPPVMPPHESTTLTLTGLALNGLERVLDLGCGSGVIALQLAATGHRAAGTDINPRALLFSRWNAAANRLPATFHPAGELATAAPFDHVVFNSPTGPAFASENDHEPEVPMSAVDAVTVASDTGRRYLRPGGGVTVFLILEVVDDLTAARAALERVAGPDFEVDFLDQIPSPAFTVTRDNMARGRLHPLSLLASRSDRAEGVLTRLCASGVKEVRPCRLRMTRVGAGRR